MSTLLLPTNPTELWTLVLAIGTIGLVIAAVVGLRSLRLTRAAMINEATRESRLCAIARCEEFADTLIPMRGAILTHFAGHRIGVFVQGASEVRFDPDNKLDLEGAEEWMKALPPEALRACSKLLNRLEAWAMYFTQGLASADVAFGPCAPIYCSIVVQLYAYLLIMRADEYSGKYPNLVMLYKTWIDKRTVEKDGLKMSSLIEQLNDLQERGINSYHSLPDPIGMKIE